MKITFEVSRNLGNGIWEGKADKSELTRLMPAPKSKGRMSIVGLVNPTFDSIAKTVSVGLDSIEVISAGSSNDTLLVDQTTTPVNGGEEQPTIIEEPVMIASSPLTSEFVRASVREGLPIPLIQLMDRILHRVGAQAPFTLSEGKARKWTADPNFVAITIQNRNRQYLISVKGDHRRMNYQTIHPVAGRGISYSEFHLNSENQFQEAMDAIRKSAAI